MIVSCVVTDPLTMPEERKRPSTLPARSRVSKARALSSGREGDAFGFGAAGAEDAIVTIALAGGGHHCFQDGFGSPGCLQVCDAVAEVELLLACSAAALGLGAVAAGSCRVTSPIWESLVRVSETRRPAMS